MGAAVQLLKTAEEESAGFELAVRPIPPALAPFLRSWAGYVERTDGPLRRRELPGPHVVVILEFGPPISVFESGGDQRSERYPGGFVAGLDESYSYCEHAGFQSGFELKLTPLGARTLFGVPLSELARTVVRLSDLLPRDQRALAERLAAAGGWEARFDIVEALLLRAARAADPQLSPAIWAARKIEAAAGAVDIGGLCDELGYSHKHVLSLFQKDVGLSPKLYARLVRFDATVQQLQAAGVPALDSSRSWAELAFEHGYADQSHLVRELKHFSGLTPSELRRMLAGFPT